MIFWVYWDIGAERCQSYPPAPLERVPRKNGGGEDSQDLGPTQIKTAAANLQDNLGPGRPLAVLMGGSGGPYTSLSRMLDQDPQDC